MTLFAQFKNRCIEVRLINKSIMFGNITKRQKDVILKWYLYPLLKFSVKHLSSMLCHIGSICYA